MNFIEYLKQNMFIILMFYIAFSQFAHADRITLEEDIADGYLDEYSKIEAAFILSGITQPDSLRRYLNWYDQLLAKINTFSLDQDDQI